MNTRRALHTMLCVLWSGSATFDQLQSAVFLNVYRHSHPFQFSLSLSLSPSLPLSLSLSLSLPLPLSPSPSLLPPPFLLFLCRRRLPVVMVKLHMVQRVSEASTFVEQGRILFTFFVWVVCYHFCKWKQSKYNVYIIGHWKAPFHDEFRNLLNS